MLYQAVVFIHLVAARTWVGGTLFMVLAMVPMDRRGMQDSGTAGVVFLTSAAQRFVTLAWISIALLVLTGVHLAWAHWEVRPHNFFTASGIFFRILQARVGLTITVIVLRLVRDFL